MISKEDQNLMHRLRVSGLHEEADALEDELRADPPVFPLPLWGEVDIGAIRVEHRFNPTSGEHRGFTIYELKNAGKKYRRSRIVYVTVIGFDYDDGLAEWDAKLSNRISNMKSFSTKDEDYIESEAKKDGVRVVVTSHNPSAAVVRPGGDNKMEMNTPQGLHIVALPDRFWVEYKWRDVEPQIFVSGDEDGAAKFFAWFEGHRRQAWHMHLDEIISLWKSIGAKYEET